MRISRPIGGRTARAGARRRGRGGRAGRARATTSGRAATPPGRGPRPRRSTPAAGPWRPSRAGRAGRSSALVRGLEALRRAEVLADAVQPMRRGRRDAAPPGDDERDLAEADRIRAAAGRRRRPVGPGDRGGQRHRGPHRGRHAARAARRPAARVPARDRRRRARSDRERCRPARRAQEPSRGLSATVAPSSSRSGEPPAHVPSPVSTRERTPPSPKPARHSGHRRSGVQAPRAHPRRGERAAWRRLWPGPRVRRRPNRTSR